MNSTPPKSELRMVIAPASDYERSLDFRGLVEFMNEQGNFTIQIEHCSDYAEAINALENGSAQIGWLGSYAYLEMEEKGIVEPFGIGIREGENSPNYQSVFIARANDNISCLTDIKKRRLAISDTHSTSGYAVPRRELAEIGIHLENAHEFASLITTHNHDEAISHVICGKADVAAVSSINLDENIASGTLDRKDIKIIHISPDIPGAPLVFSTTLPQGTRDWIKSTVLNAHKSIQVGGYGGRLQKYVDPAESRMQFLESYLRPQWGWRTFSVLSLLVGLSSYFFIDLEIELMGLFANMSSYFVDIFYRMLPPDFSNPGTLLLSMLETIEIAFLGTLLAILLSIPIGILSAHNVAPHPLIYVVTRTITVFFRAVPEFIMAMILVIAVGFGAIPGVLALGFHTMGFLAKFYAEDIEHVDPGPVEALESTGAKPIHVLAFGIIPQIIPSFIGNNLYILDRNVRMATMLGIVGAGGIGYELQSSFRMFEYPRVSAIVITIFITIFFIDLLSSAIRKKVQ